MYRSEAAFSRALRAAIKKDGMNVTAIETGSTSQGVPDLYITGCKTGDCWLELKNTYEDLTGVEKFKVAWRPGQQAWHMRYFKAMRHKCVWTAVAHKKGIALIRMVMHYKDNIVTYNQVPFRFKTVSQLSYFIKTTL